MPCASSAVSAGRCGAAHPKPPQVTTRATRDGDATACSSSSAVPSPRPRRDYGALFRRAKQSGGNDKCPPLFLAPMEGLGDHRLRRALVLSTGGFDEACREFTRVPGTLSQGAKAEKLLRGIALNGYDARELMILESNAGMGYHGTENDAGQRVEQKVRHAHQSLLAAQLMGSTPELLRQCAFVLATEGGAPRVDLNCGCPATVVTGKGAGSGLLRDPYLVEQCIAAVATGVRGTGCAVSLKMRSGFDDRSLLRDNLLAAQAG